MPLEPRTSARLPCGLCLSFGHEIARQPIGCLAISCFTKLDTANAAESSQQKSILFKCVMDQETQNQLATVKISTLIKHFVLPAIASSSIGLAPLLASCSLPL